MKKQNGCLNVIVVFLIILFFPVLLYISPILLFVWLALKLYTHLYFKSDKFLAIKQRLANHAKECNELNEHIEELKSSALVVNRTDYGEANYHDDSSWKVNRTGMQKSYKPTVYQCSRTVCDNASREPFKYICKYFGIKADEETLEKFETMLNDFSAVEDGKKMLMQQLQEILDSVDSEIPNYIKKHCKEKLVANLGFEKVDLGTLYFPRYVFQYTSPSGNTGTHYDVVMDIDNLNRFVVYLAEKIKFNKSAAGQRALMTSRLRESIKQRDSYTCRCCGASLSSEPHLLLEIDHIIPVSKGGKTTEENLQTLCWKCNRSKGNKTPA